MNLRDIKRPALILLVLLVTACSWFKPMTDLAAAQVDAGLKRSLISFASARALNGAISVLQGTEVAVHPVGVGVSLSVGEILDPINDLVESLSSVMLTASVAFGIEKLLLSIGSNWAVSALVTGVAVLWSFLFLARAAPLWLSRLMLGLLFVRFVMPLALIGSAVAFDRFSADDYRQSQAVLDRTTSTLQDAAAQAEAPAPAAATPVPPEAPTAAEGGVMDWLRDKATALQTQAQSVLSSIPNPTEQLTRQFAQLQETVENTAERMIRLIVIFLMQTVVIPLLLLWALYRLTVGLPMAPPPVRRAWGE